MPPLRDLVCVVQWANTGSPFPEYGTQYGDGVVETYIAIPSHPQAFTIRLTSRKFIYEGLSMVVFIDGNYQCNRNRVNLQPYKKGIPTNRSEVDFIVRQKEKPMGDGTYLGREWRFDDHNIVPDVPPGVNQSHFDELGTIEVLVLRCHTHNTTESQMSSSSSGEDSLFISGDVTTFNQEEDDPGPNNVISKDRQEPEVEDSGFGGMFGLFDGPSDYPPRFYSHQVTPPLHGYHQSRDWLPPNGDYERRRPQRPSYLAEQPQPQPHPHPQHHPQGPNPLYYHRQQSYDRERPPSHTYPPYGPGRPERRVHFDYGDTESRNDHHHARYDRYPLHPERPVWRDNSDQFHSRPGPEYQDADPHPRGPNPYADYALPPSNGHYAYDAENRSYHPYPDQSQVHGNHPQPEPTMRNSPQFTSHMVQPVQQPIQPTVLQQQPGPTAFSIPSVPWVGSQPPFPSQPIPVMVPPNLVPVPQPVTGMPIYPAPGGAPFLHLQTPANMPNMMPQPIPAPFNIQPIGQQNTMQQTTNANTFSSGVNHGPAVSAGDHYTPPCHSCNNNNDDNGTSGNIGQSNEWNDPTGNRGYNNESGGNGDANQDKDNAQSKSWDNGQTNNANGDWRNSQNESGNNDWNNDQNKNTNDGWNNDQTNNNNADDNWNKDQTNNGNDDWNNGQNSNNKTNENWNNDQTNNANDDWNNGQNNNTNNNWNNGQANNSNPTMDNTPTPAMPGKRSLYGPYGAYFAPKVFAEAEVPANAEEEPRYDVPQAMVRDRGTSKQVQPGKGYLYNKKRCAPKYVDNMDVPYARFVFKYRTKEQIKKETGIEVTAEPSPNEDVNSLERLDKNELIQLVIRAKGALGGEIPAPLPKDAVAKTPTPSFEQVPVAPPETAFLRYNLPPARVVSSQGLGIKNSPNNNTNNQQDNAWDNNQQPADDQNWGSNGNNNNAGAGGDDWSKDNNGGASGWNNNTQNNSNGGGWDNQPNNNVTSGTGAGWDGQQEKTTTNNVNNSRSDSFGVQNQGSGTMRNTKPEQQQNNSRRSSAISPKSNNMNAANNNPPAGGDPELAAYLENAAKMGGPAGPNLAWATPAGPPQQPWQTQNQQQQQPNNSGIQTIGTGFIGGGGSGAGGVATTTSLNYHTKPPTPELKPCSPATVDNGEWSMGAPAPAPDQNQNQAGFGAVAAAPGGGW